MGVRMSQPVAYPLSSSLLPQKPYNVIWPGLLPPRKILARIDCSSFAQSTKGKVAIAVGRARRGLIAHSRSSRVKLVESFSTLLVAHSRKHRFGTVSGAWDVVFRWTSTDRRTARRFQTFSMVVAANQKWSSRRVPVCLIHIVNSRPFQNRSINNRDMSDFRNFHNYSSPQFFDWSKFYMSGAVWIDRKIESLLRNYFRFPSAIFETDCNRLGQSLTVGIQPGNTSNTGWTARKNNVSLLPPRMIVSGIDCSSLAKLEYVQKHVKGSVYCQESH